MQVIDAHCHIIEPGYPLTSNQGFVPDPFSTSDYRERTQSLTAWGYEVVGGVVVAGSFQGYDTGWLAHALEGLGRQWVGVVNLPEGVSDQEILQLDTVGARAVRMNLRRGVAPDLAAVERLARRVYDVAGWHTEFYLDGSDLPALKPLLQRLPRITIDHLGMGDTQEDLLVSLAADGAVVKATGFGRIDVRDPAARVRRLLKANPHSVMFGTDLPSTRARRPFDDADLRALAEWSGGHGAAVLAGTARRLYRLPQ